MRPAYLAVAVPLLWSLACAKGRTPHEGVWTGTCTFASEPEKWTIDLELSDREGFCDVCEGDFPVIQGYGELHAPAGTTPIFADWWHCVDPAGCVDSDGVEHPEDYVTWRADPTQSYEDTFDLWFEGKVDPDDKHVVKGTCGYEWPGFQPLVGPGRFTRTGDAD